MTEKTSPANQVFEKIKEESATYIDFRFTDLNGNLKHTTYLATSVTEEMLNKGFVFRYKLDNKNALSFNVILCPDCGTVFLDTCASITTLVVVCDILDTSGKLYAYNPRGILKKAKNYLSSTLIAEDFTLSSSLDFSIFDNVDVDENENVNFFAIKYPFAEKSEKCTKDTLPYENNFSTCDLNQDLRCEIVLSALDSDISITNHCHICDSIFHRVYFKKQSCLQQADSIQAFKQIAKSVASSYSKALTFHPKPLDFKQGNSLSFNCSLFKHSKSLFQASNDENISVIATYFIAGVLHHIKSIMAFTNPYSASYIRVSSDNFSLFSSDYSTSTANKMISFTFPDSACNPYLAYATLLMAGLDGITNKLPISDSNKIQAEVKKLTLADTVKALKKDNAFLKAGGVFSDECIDFYVKEKEKEVSENSPVSDFNKMFYW